MEISIWHDMPVSLRFPFVFAFAMALLVAITSIATTAYKMPKRVAAIEITGPAFGLFPLPSFTAFAVLIVLLCFLVAFPVHFYRGERCQVRIGMHPTLAASATIASAIGDSATIGHAT